MKIKHILIRTAAFFFAGLAVFALIAGVFIELLGILGFGLINWGGLWLLIAFVLRKNRRPANGVLFLGILLFTFALTHT